MHCHKRQHAPWDITLQAPGCESLVVVCGVTSAPSTVRPLARDLRVLVGWPFPLLGFGLDGRLLLARRGRVYV